MFSAIRSYLLGGSEERTMTGSHSDRRTADHPALFVHKLLDEKKGTFKWEPFTTMKNYEVCCSEGRFIWKAQSTAYSINDFPMVARCSPVILAMEIPDVEITKQKDMNGGRVIKHPYFKGETKLVIPTGLILLDTLSEEQKKRIRERHKARKEKTVAEKEQGVEIKEKEVAEKEQGVEAKEEGVEENEYPAYVMASLDTSDNQSWDFNIPTNINSFLDLEQNQNGPEVFVEEQEVYDVAHMRPGHFDARFEFTIHAEKVGRTFLVFKPKKIELKQRR